MIRDPAQPPRDPYRRPAKNSKFLIVIIVAAATVVALQYTPRAIFSSEKTSTLWGMLTGLVLGGFLFGWLTLRRDRDGE
jgi:branched-subunit amino acid transport protein AzlD